MSIPIYSRGFMAGIEKAIALIQTTEEQEQGRLRNFLMQELVGARPEIPVDLQKSKHDLHKDDALVVEQIVCDYELGSGGPISHGVKFSGIKEIWWTDDETP